MSLRIVQEGAFDRDPVAAMVALVRPRAVLSASLDATGPWALAFDAYPHVKFGVVEEGRVVVRFGGKKQIVAFDAGDVYLFVDPPPYTMASEDGPEPRPAGPVFRGARGATVRLGRGGAGPRTRIAGGHFVLDPTNARLLLDVLPRWVRIDGAREEGTYLRTLASCLRRESASERVGRALVLDRLAQVVLVEALRVHGESGKRGWLGALADPALGRVLRTIHADVAKRHSVASLARVAGMSRSAFALAFKRVVGKAPLDYTIDWKMSLARDALRHDEAAIGALAFALGYLSESAFSTAFRREVGASPIAYRRAALAERGASARSR